MFSGPPEVSHALTQSAALRHGNCRKSLNEGFQKSDCICRPNHRGGARNRSPHVDIPYASQPMMDPRRGLAHRRCVSGSAALSTPGRIGDLSLRPAPPASDSDSPSKRGRSPRNRLSSNAAKRTASNDPPGCTSPKIFCADGPKMLTSMRPPSAQQGATAAFNALQHNLNAVQHIHRTGLPIQDSQAADHTKLARHVRHPSNMVSLLASAKPPSKVPPLPGHLDRVPNKSCHVFLPDSAATSTMMKEPEASRITAEQLATEVKIIYSGLVMVESKCINIDAAQAADPHSKLSSDQWQALIALHRTLLYEHHDFLMATQHPAATRPLRDLALKYCMPARMWKHGIHAFLEVLRHHRPASHDFMLAFIYLAYQMMALLYETVDVFQDTWIECLGDLARYRMAIEEEKEAHATWGGVASRWYTMASDRSPQVGRLYHHLGILERPSLRKLCMYMKSLTATIPFPNARDSLNTLCAPIVQDEKTVESSDQSVEARIVTFHALVCSGKPQAVIERVGNDALRLMGGQGARLREIGAYHAITCISSLFERGQPMNPLWRLYAAEKGAPPTNPDPLSAETFYAVSDTLEFCAHFCYESVNLVLRAWHERSAIFDRLQCVHVMLAWQRSLHLLRRERSDENLLDENFRLLVAPSRLSWSGLVDFLNSLLEFHHITALILAHGREGNFPRVISTPAVSLPSLTLQPPSQVIPKPEHKPLSEDHLLRGLAWTKDYFPDDHFARQSPDDGRAIESNETAEDRADRVLWLGLYLAFHTSYISYDEEMRVFSCTAESQSSTPRVVSRVPTLPTMTTTISSTILPPTLTSSVVPEDASITMITSTKRTSSSLSPSEDGYHLAKHPRLQDLATRQGPRSSKTIASKCMAQNNVPGKFQEAGMPRVRALDRYDASVEHGLS